MPKRVFTDEQKKAQSERIKAMWAKKRLEKEQGDLKIENNLKIQKESLQSPPEPAAPPTVAPDQSTLDLQAQVKELQETQALMKALLLNQSQGQAAQGIDIGRGNKLVGEVEKYLIDPANYPDPTPRLAKEKRLAPLAFNYNYELMYKVDVSNYETKTGINMKEPKFLITLLKAVIDDQGEKVRILNPTTKKMEDKYYIARNLVFHEDPQAAIVIARENGLEVDKTNEKAFLDEMRYLRVRDWLFDIFWPKPVQPGTQIREEVIGGTIVQVFTKNSEESSNVDFTKLKNKIA